MSKNSKSDSFDAIVVGAGFAGLYLLHKLREKGLRVLVLEAGAGVGGTWYWNRYPGARCDAESMAYSYSFSDEMEQEWQWSERYATQPEILRYVNHVADRFDLWRDIRLNTRVTHAIFEDERSQWTVETEQGNQLTAQFCIMATGCLSTPQVPDIAGLDQFAGPTYYTSQWPHQEVDFSGLRVGLIGTGSSAIQAVPVIASQAKQLTVFQRTANFSVPAKNCALDSQWVVDYKKDYPRQREHYRQGQISGFGDLIYPEELRMIGETLTSSLSLEQANDEMEKYWQLGGARFMATFMDTMVDEGANEIVAGFVRNKIRDIVTDPDTAEMLCPKTHPIGTKRICVDTGYFETFNLPSVRLVDVANTPIKTITESGLDTTEQQFEFDVLVLATGFDAMTGTLLMMDIRGLDGMTLRSKWEAGPRSYLGLGISGFPNLLTITGPGSPSVLSNMIVSIEQHIDWISDFLDHMRENDFTRFEAELSAEDEWVDHVNEVANATLYPKGGSWYLGANIPGKPRVFMPYAGGVGPYRALCDEVTASGYKGFSFS